MKDLVDIQEIKIEIDAQHDDQAYDSKTFGLEAVCPPGSPSERLRECGLDISSYLLGAPSQVFMKSKIMAINRLTEEDTNVDKDWTSVYDNTSIAPISKSGYLLAVIPGLFKPQCRDYFNFVMIILDSV